MIMFYTIDKLGLNTGWFLSQQWYSLWLSGVLGLLSSSAFTESIEAYCMIEGNCLNETVEEYENLLHTVLIIFMVVGVLFTLFVIREAGHLSGQNIFQGFAETCSHAECPKLPEGTSEEMNQMCCALFCLAFCFGLFFPIGLTLLGIPLGYILSYPIIRGGESSPDGYCEWFMYFVGILLFAAPSVTILIVTYLWVCEDKIGSNDHLDPVWVDVNCFGTDIILLLIQIFG